MAQTVVGFFDNSAEAQQAVAQLISSGISRDRIDVSSGNASTGSNTYNSDSSTYNSDISDDNDSHKESGITRFFKSLFGDDDDEADRYSRVAAKSQSIVTVHCQSSDEADSAADILDDSGAIDVDERASQYGYSSDRTGTDSNKGINADQEINIPVVEENLEVGKRTKETGGVRVRSRIIERPVEEHVRLREEEIHVERNPVDRPISQDELGSFQEKDVELTERAEVPVVNKEARVVEEVRVSKEVTERDETIHDTVRKTDVDVEKLDKGQTSSSSNLNRGDDLLDRDDDDITLDRDNDITNTSRPL